MSRWVFRSNGFTPRVFVVYSHESAQHSERVWDLVHRLRKDGGVDAWFDGYEQAPPQGWPRWSVEQIDSADFVLVICTPVLRRRFEGMEVPGCGLGTRWEARAITIRLLATGGRNTKFLPVLLDGEPETSIPEALRGYHFHRDPAGYETLLRLIRRSPLRVPVPVTSIPTLLPRAYTPLRSRDGTSKPIHVAAGVPFFAVACWLLYSATCTESLNAAILSLSGLVALMTSAKFWNW